MVKGILAQLLEALEKTRPLSRHPILAELVQASREPIEGQWKYPFHLVRHAAIEIMQSGIFVEDRLKGKKIPSVPPKFQSYPIKDPEELVWLIAMPLVRDIEDDISSGMCNFTQIEIKCYFSEIVTNLDRLSEFLGTWGEPIRIDVRERNLKDYDAYQTEIKRYFTEIVTNMDPFPGIIETWANPRIKRKIDKIKKELESLKKDLLANLPEKFFNLRDHIDYMLNILQKHVPEAPEETIAKRVVDILKIYNIQDVRYQTVLQRMYRKKQKRT